MSGKSNVFKYKLIEYKGFKLHADSVSIMPEVEELECHKDDFLLASFMKSGSTWTDTIITLMLNGGDPKSLTRDAAKSGLYKTLGFLEIRFSNNIEEPRDLCTIDAVKAMQSPKGMRTHLPCSLLPPAVLANKLKVVYIYRNVKDVMWSLYRHLLHNPYKIVDYLGTFDEFVLAFMKDNVVYCPYFGHLHSYWKNRNEPNFLIFSYEELTKDHVGIIRRIAKFLELPLTEEQVELVRHHSTLEQMRAMNHQTWREWFSAKDETGAEVHNFLGNAKAGSGSSQLSPETNAKVDQWIANNLQDYDFGNVNPFETV
ncbi:hypothetical protein RvY_17022 [Ramazzottius varieornatus]|uniref:Sulfotransferase domain-containing protein n=1 Tax=Ramazzottius varieornatus TaxID=947166 RepID=A0A1D1W0M8_RAMVA|nr:hypothetical protein RvY_17022 [Ramazzottius varieornatus]